MGTEGRTIFTMSTLFFVGTVFFSSSRAFADDKPEPAPMILHSPTAKSGTLTPPATGQLLEPEVRPARDHLSFGINDLGAQLRYYVTRNWAAEYRFLTGSSSSDAGTVHSNVFGMREYRFFPEAPRWRLYVGAEEDYVKSSIRSISASDTNPLG